MNWVAAFAVCLGAAAAEGILAGKNPRQFLRELRQPRWSAPFIIWVLIGLYYYAAAFFALAVLFGGALRLAPVQLAVVLLIFILATNAGGNWLLFRRRDFRAFHYLMYPYAAAVISLIALLARFDAISALLWAVYGAYLLYAIAWTRAVWRMNRVPINDVG